jgi:peptidoglycan/LPS O-acetylase OafA/YrhL
VLAWFGERSYGLYLFHVGALRLVHGNIPALAVTIALAALSYRYLEQPCIRYGRDKPLRLQASVSVAVTGAH